MKFVRDVIIFVSLLLIPASVGLRAGISFGYEQSDQQEPTIVYATTLPTNRGVIAGIMLEDGCEVLNNDGNTTYSFTDNGTFRFEYADRDGNISHAVAQVENIDIKAPSAALVTSLPKKTKAVSYDLVTGGQDVQQYKYKLDDMPYSSVRDIDTQIKIRRLGFGMHTLALVGRDAAGNWQSASEATVYEWEVLFSDEHRSRVTSYDRGVKVIEVSIDKQHMWVYEGSRVIMHTSVTTGANGMSTERGSFAISQMHMNKYFDGGYFSYYWMRFNKGMGMHDALWRDQFGTDDYVWRGSHGCINMPYDKAQWLYGWGEIGTPVTVL